jgi:hypothetical protein
VDLLDRAHRRSRRQARFAHHLDRGDEAVPDPVHRGDHFLPVSVVAHRAASVLQPAGQRGVADVAVPPDSVEKLELGYDAVPVLDQVDRVLAAVPVDAAVSAAFLRVLNLIDEPQALFSPSLMPRVLRPRRHSAPVENGFVVGKQLSRTTTE